MEARELYRDHVREVRGMAESALAAAVESGARFEGIVLHAGSTSVYHADDLAVPFRSVPHFARFTPFPGPDHLLVLRPGRRMRLALVVPQDYWEEPPTLLEQPSGPERPDALDDFDVAVAPSFEAAAVLAGDLSRCAYVGSSPAAAARLGIPLEAVEPRSLLAGLDWHRGFKTAYEVACIREANRIAARGHAAARKRAAEGRCEREIHAAYLEATGALEGETPYPNIIAWDDRSSILHYQRKRTSPPDPGHSFLIDAGARYAGYASDVTRTYTRPGAHPLFVRALDEMEALQQRLVASVEAGGSFVQLHAAALLGVASILCELGVLRVDAAEACERKLVLPFLPHGLGHHLGLQVHDVGGQQLGRTGEHRPPPPEHPYLRTTRDLAARQVVTIEPGLYFVPRLLEPYRSGESRLDFDWTLVDALVPCGGIRIEDDVHVTEGGPENLTRPFVPGHAGG
jgi:Xaa-Pro dipeptidase